MVTGVAWAPDGKLIAIASTVGIYIYSVATMEEVSFIRTPSLISCVAFSPDGQALAAGSWDRTIRLWRVSDGKLLQTLVGDTNWVGVYGSDRAKDLANGEGIITSLAFSKDGLTLASGYEYGDLLLWQISSGKLLQTLGNQGTTGVWSIAFSPDGKILASGSGNGIALWNVSDWTSLRTMKENPWCLAFSPDGKILVSGGYYGIDIWRVSDGARINTLGRNNDMTSSVAFSPDGQTLASYGRLSPAKLWRVSDWTLVRTLGSKSGKDQDLHGSGTNQTMLYYLSAGNKGTVAFSPDGQELMLGLGNQGYGSGVLFFRVLDGTWIRDLIWSNQVGDLAFSPDCKTLAVGESSPDNEEVVLRRVSDGSIEWRVQQAPLGILGTQSGVNNLVFNPDGQVLAAASRYWSVSESPNGYQYQIQLLKASDGTLLLTIPTTFEDDNLIFSRDSQILAYRSNGNVHILRVSDGKLIYLMQGQNGIGMVGNIAFSPDGLTLASGSSDNAVRIWRVSDWKLLYTLKGDQAISSVEFSPDGKTLASVSGHGMNLASGSDQGGIIRLWNVSDGTPLYTLKGDNGILYIAFSPDGKTLESVSDQDDKIQLWNVSDGTSLTPITFSNVAPLYSSTVEIAYSPNGTLFAIGSSYDGTITLWGNAP